MCRLSYSKQIKTKTNLTIEGLPIVGLTEGTFQDGFTIFVSAGVQGLLELFIVELMES